MGTPPDKAGAAGGGSSGGGVIDWGTLLRQAPEEALKSEWARRNAAKRKMIAGGRSAGCNCGKCGACKQREYRRTRRKQSLDR
jgi:hypothetical protein